MVIKELRGTREPPWHGTPANRWAGGQRCSVAPLSARQTAIGRVNFIVKQLLITNVTLSITKVATIVSQTNLTAENTTLYRRVNVSGTKVTYSQSFSNNCKSIKKRSNKQVMSHSGIPQITTSRKSSKPHWLQHIKYQLSKKKKKEIARVDRIAQMMMKLTASCNHFLFRVAKQQEK